MACTHAQPRHLLNVPRESELELSAGSIPNLYSAIGSTRSKPLVAGVEGNRTYPPAGGDGGG